MDKSPAVDQSPRCHWPVDQSPSPRCHCQSPPSVDQQPSCWRDGVLDSPNSPVLALAVLAANSTRRTRRGGAAGGGRKVGGVGLDLQVGAKVLAFLACRCSHLIHGRASHLGTSELSSSSSSGSGCRNRRLETVCWPVAGDFAGVESVGDLVGTGFGPSAIARRAGSGSGQSEPNVAVGTVGSAGSSSISARFASTPAGQLPRAAS